MSEKKWLLKENVENAPVGKLLTDGVQWSPALKRGFIADWLEMRKLCQRLINVGDLTLENRVKVWDDICDMLIATK